MITIRDVAKASGVSISTVSNVITGAPRPVSAHIRAKVLHAAKTLNYHPNSVAQALVRRRVDAIGVLSGLFSASDIVTNEYAAGVMSGIVQAASRAGQNITLYTQFWRGAAQSLSMFRDRRADGIILISPPSGSDIITAVSGLNIPLVTVSASVSEQVPTVDDDHVHGARIAIEHLVSLGHRKIAHVHGNMDLISAPLRLQAYRTALTEFGLDAPTNYVQGANYDGSGGQEAANKLLSLADRPTAVFAGNDRIAISLIRAATAMGIRVPEDLSVLGYDDSPIAELFTPALTTVRQSLLEIGARAAELLLEKIEGNTVEARIYLLAPKLVVRSSTAAPAAT